MRPAACVLVGALFFLAGCKKPQPSVEYTEASGLYTTLLAKYGDDAYEDPEMDRVESLLARVPSNSLDAQAANELKGRIAADRKRAEQEARERQKAIDSATAPQPPVDFGSSAPVAEAPLEPVDAGPGDFIVPGMSIEAMRTASDNCFSPSGPMKLRNPDKSEVDAEMFERVSSTRCEAKFPRYASRFLVFKEGKLVGDFDKAALTTLAPPKAPEPEKPAPPPAKPPPPVVEPGGDKPPTPQPAPTSPGENTAPAPVSP